MMSIPITLLIIIEVKSDFKSNCHLCGLIASIGTSLYCMIEEYGWIGYLTNELKRLKS
ncbi:hypothetical protein [Polaribacter irgensii]|uniref:hypothetical protein n=1 Tax=Polaribacter irgensii TaxID=531 RepID=UPI0012DC4854|nr:hypothetical protein [Polaribacter irgensii]